MWSSPSATRRARCWRSNRAWPNGRKRWPTAGRTERGGQSQGGIGRHSYLSAEQREAVRFITSEREIEALTGFAGAGKSAAIAAAREAWQAEGYRVLGGALSGIAAETWKARRGIDSRTLASWERAWKEGHGGFTALMYWLSTRLAWSAAASLRGWFQRRPERGAKAVLVGDAEQFQPIEAGAAFRAIAERAGYQELSGIRRQLEAWQRNASRHFARGAAGQGV